MKKRIFALLVAVVMIFTFSFGAVSAYAEDTDLNYAESTFDTVVEAIWNAGFAGLELSLDAFKVAVEVGGWIWDGATFTLTDPLTNISYGILEDGTLGRSGRSGGGGRIRVDTASDIDVSGKTFTEICAQLSEQYAPEASSGRFSWKDDYRCTSNGVAFGRFYSEGEFLNGKSLDLYLIPFYDDGEHVYFPLSQYHFSQKTTFNDSGGLSSLMIYYKLITSTDHTAITEDVAFLNSLAYRYADLGFGVYCNGSSAFGPYMAHYDSYSNYVNIKPLSAGNMAYISYTDYYSDYMRYFYYDLNETPIDHYTEMVYYNADPSTVTTDIDFGFYYSDKPITMQIIEPVTFEDDDVVTLTGDNIYDYTITNNQGDTTTINYYINNNYTYPETDSGEDDSSGTGGTVGGDVTVSGDIGVNGSVDVNINVNGGSGVTTDPYDYVDPNVEEALNQLPEMGDGFISFFSNMFAWLPAEVLGLLIGGIGLAIVCRIAGR